MPAVAVIGLDALAQLKEVRKAAHEDLDVRPHPGGVGSLNPHKITHQDVDTQLVVEGRLPHVLVGPKQVTLLCSPLLGDAKVRPIHQHEAVVAYVVDAELAVKVNMWFGGEMVVQQVIIMVRAGGGNVGNKISNGDKDDNDKKNNDAINNNRHLYDKDDDHLPKKKCSPQC